MRACEFRKQLKLEFLKHIESHCIDKRHRAFGTGTRTNDDVGVRPDRDLSQRERRPDHHRSGGQLEEIGYSSLRISTVSGSFECSGDFGEYQSMKSRIDDLRYKHQSPAVTVKGIYTKSSYSSERPAVKNCILTDLKR